MMEIRIRNSMEWEIMLYRLVFIRPQSFRFVSFSFREMNISVNICTYNKT